MRTLTCILAGVVATFLLTSSAHSQAFWCGNSIADFLDPNTADAYHDYLVDTVMPTVRGAINTVGGNNPEGDKGVTIYEPDRCCNG